MNDEKYLSHLLYCSKCFLPTSNSSDPFYIGECMHILCTTCFSSPNKCLLCSSPSKFILLTSEFTSKLLKNPTEIFTQPVEASMFQLNSAINLVIRQKKEITKLKAYLKKAKDELVRIRSGKQNTEKKSLFNFETDNVMRPKETIDKIYSKSNVGLQNDRKKGNYLNDITNKALEKKFFTNYKQADMSLSSSKSSRLTIPKQENEFKYVYRRQNQF